MNIPLLICLLLFLLIESTSSLPNVIKIGGLFTQDEHEQELVFRFAVDRINQDSSILSGSKLIAEVERINDKSDTFHADKKVCSLVKRGAIAIFGPLSLGPVSTHIQSICDSLEIPHVETRWDFQQQRDQLSINLYPKPSTLTHAYVDLVEAWNWKSFAIVYDNNEGLIRVQDFFKVAEKNEWSISLFQFTPNKPYRDVFWEIHDQRHVNVILDVQRDKIKNVLKHAQQVGMMTEVHSYLILSLDLHTIDLEDFKFGKTKITALRLVDVASPELQSLMADWSLLATRNHMTQHISPPQQIKTETALIYDGVKLLATGLHDLNQSQSVDTIMTTSCEIAKPWQYGTSLLNYMRPITFRGVTGLVGFDQSGFRSSFSLDIMAITNEGLQKIGTWTESGKLNISESWMSHYIRISMHNKTLIVTTLINAPYVMLKDSPTSKKGNERFEGFCVDLIHELSELLHFRYEFKLCKDGAYGIKKKDGTWNGMIGELIRNEADIAIVDLTITSKREEAVDFTLPFMNTGISILYKKPTTKVTTLFSFLSPFSGLVWIYVAGAYISVSLVLFIVGRLSPYEWDNPHPCRQQDHVLENSFSLMNSFSFTIGSMMQQGSALAPKAMSTRSIAAIWYFFTLIMISSYTANLAAFLTVEKVVYPIESAEELSLQTKIEYGCLRSGSTKTFFEDHYNRSIHPTYVRMWEFMSKRDHVFVGSNNEGIDKVLQADGKYAYMMESASIEYNIERNCNLTQIGGLLDTKGYGIATRKDSPYRTPLSQAILKLGESGVLHLLKDRWWKQKKGGGKCVEDSKKSSIVNELNLGNVGGVFVVLLGGLSLSFLIVIFEFMWKARKSTNDLTESMCEEMMRDLKFALQCHSRSKAVKKKNNFMDDKIMFQQQQQFGAIY